MNARTKAFPRIVSLTMAIAMALTMVVSAYVNGSWDTVTKNFTASF